MELEFKHLAPYLPYKIMCEIVGSSLGGQVHELRGCIYDPLLTLGEGGRYGFIQRVITEVRPILRPLSLLTQEITHNGETFVPIEALQSIAWDDDLILRWYPEEKGFELITEGPSSSSWAFYEYQNWPYWIVETLIFWHFDVFNLIESGLAIEKPAK